MILPELQNSKQKLGRFLMGMDTAARSTRVCASLSFGAARAEALFTIDQSHTLQRDKKSILPDTFGWTRSGGPSTTAFMFKDCRVCLLDA